MITLLTLFSMSSAFAGPVCSDEERVLLGTEACNDLDVLALGLPEELVAGPVILSANLQRHDGCWVLPTVDGPIAAASLPLVPGMRAVWLSTGLLLADGDHLWVVTPRDALQLGDGGGLIAVGVTNDHLGIDEIAVGVTNDHLGVDEIAVGVTNDHLGVDVIAVGVTNDHRVAASLDPRGLDLDGLVPVLPVNHG
jgi:hypothetical protein